MEKEIETMNREWENILSMLGSGQSDFDANGYSDHPANENTSDLLPAQSHS